MKEPGRRCSKCGESYAVEVIFCPRDGTPLTARKTEVGEDPYLGLTIGAQFRIEQLVGIGAMGRVYRAHQAGVERNVAVKVMHRDLLKHDNLVARFRREAKVGGSLLHPNLVQVFALGEIEPLAPEVGGEAYMVLEYLDGISLRSALAAAGGALPLPRALHVMLQVCDALGEAHARGVVHRDLKPENMMLVRRGDDADFVKVLDFGVARMAEGDPNVATQAGAVFGTARYVSPEGAQGAMVGAPGDVYSIATLLFQSLSGQTPFDGDNPVAILVKHTSEPAPDIRSIPRSSYVPEPLARAIAQNLSKDPAKRCRDARDLGKALVQAARDSGLSPDDLIFRSTLLGSRGPLALASIERTRQLQLGESFSRALAAGGPTELLERPLASSAGANSAPAEKSSGVEPTWVDEPLPSAPTADLGPRVQLGLERASIPSFPAGELPDSNSWLPGSPIGRAGRRALVIGGCFAVGGAVALVVASRLGAFEKPELKLESYVERARQALELAAFDTPPGENVREITNAALHRWPEAPSIVQIRRDAARRLLERSRELSSSNRDEARRFLDLALEFDPESSEARSLRSASAEPVPSPEPEARTPAPGLKNGSGRPQPRTPVAAPAPAAPSATEAAAAPAGSAAPPEPAKGGRWL
jgi:eukaryotic-like serine/threonine-protein kinase